MTDPDDRREHDDPCTWCRAPQCRHTNWGGYARLHLRQLDCPPYQENPEPNPIADFWEDVRKSARD